MAEVDEAEYSISVDIFHFGLTSPHLTHGQTLHHLCFSCSLKTVLFSLCFSFTHSLFLLVFHHNTSTQRQDMRPLTLCVASSLASTHSVGSLELKLRMCFSFTHSLCGKLSCFHFFSHDSIFSCRFNQRFTSNNLSTSKANRSG
ncbi:hypothetical protein N665_2142s0002 [Sinapis alba]|nr:hypothetical protein N665_2142s0002 [Sinapis alba]